MHQTAVQIGLPIFLFGEIAMPTVIVVPETSDFEHDVSHNNVVWINKNLGIPHLESRNATYLAPFWLEASRGVNRVYHITDTEDAPTCTVIRLGNSFVLPRVWDGVGNYRRFEYHDLSALGMIEICPGLLIPHP